MSIVAAWAVLMAGAAVEVHIAPDQPLSHVYIDDPLVIELKSAADTEARVQLEVNAKHLTEPLLVSLDPVVLRAHGTYWWAVESIPAERAWYETCVTVATDGDTWESRGSFCRVDRPVLPGHPLPVCVSLKEFDTRTLLALKSVAVECVRLDASMDDLDRRIADVAGAGRQAVVRISVGHSEDDEARVETLSQSLADRVVLWEVNPGDDIEALGRVTRNLRRGAPRARVALVTTGSDHLKRMLEAGAGQFVEHLTVQQESPAAGMIEAVRATAERAGYEGMRMSVCYATSSASAEKTSGFIHQVFLNLMQGPAQTEVDGNVIFDHDPLENYVYLSGLAHRIRGAAYLGTLDVPAPVLAPVLRGRDEWVVAIWTTGEPGAVPVPVGEATDLVLTDLCNNPMPAPDLREGHVTIPVGPLPQLLSGRGGTVVGLTAWSMARKEANVFAKMVSSEGFIPKDLVDIAEAIAGADTPSADRLDFFTLLRMFPYIEEQWHARQMPRTVAAPAMASLARLCRHLCVVEQERGEPFLEPLQDTLACCREYQSLYLTGSAAASDRQERGDWLLEEVNRLMAEAQDLSDSARPIEAAAVAVIAEWRARALEHAARAAPLHTPDRFLSQSEVESKSQEQKNE